MKIEEIDKNFKTADLGGTPVNFYNACTAPFVIEGFLLGLFGSVFSFFIEWGLYEAIRLAIADTGTKVISILPFQEVMLPMILVCTVAGFFIGIFGSLMSIRKFLKV